MMINDKIKKILLNPIFAFLVILSYAKPAPEITGSFDIVFDLIRGSFFIIIIVCCICFKHKINNITKCLIGLQTIYLFFTFFNDGDLNSGFNQFFSNTGLMLYYDYMFKQNKTKAVINFMLPLTTMAVLTSFTMFIYYPKGLYTVSYARFNETSNYLWGFDNSSVFKFIPAMLFIGYYSFIKNKRKVYLICSICMLFYTMSFIYVKSYTAAVFTLFIFVSYLYLLLKKRGFKIINYKSVIIGVFIIFILLVFFNDHFVSLLEYTKRIDKYYSVKARFIFWDRIIDIFKSNPFIGYGFEDKTITLYKLKIDHPHNIFLDIIYRGGIIGIIESTYLLINVMKNKYKPSLFYGFSIVVFSAILLISQMDFYSELSLFYVSMIACILYSIDNR